MFVVVLNLSNVEAPASFSYGYGPPQDARAWTDAVVDAKPESSNIEDSVYETLDTRFSPSQLCFGVTPRDDRDISYHSKEEGLSNVVGLDGGDGI